MSEQLSFLSPLPAAAPVAAASRFAVCHQRDADGCGGRHAQGPEFAGRPIWRWVCCADCPHRAELNPWSAA